MKTLIRTKDIARVRHSEKHATDYFNKEYLEDKK